MIHGFFSEFYSILTQAVLCRRNVFRDCRTCLYLSLLYRIHDFF
ncbi:hypothetical protein HOLDEFILI_01028 [Holdemania filiformis DSM 12042]|uniref:Uncharacterized protein n=1 Tax=Holdemania filiformis DSM 12042 TaxID=545696 RepID=B9Y5E5_9FIRM|nr:hypothetical protein HOLDEFILI_01028 [Holdemania filiformis DSM 12042]